MAAPKPGRRRRTQAIPRYWRSRCRRRLGRSSEVPKPSPNALYTLSIGSNDVLDILANPGLGAQQQTTVANEISFVKQLVAEGARNLVVLGVPDIGKAPNVMEGVANGSDTPSAALDTEASQLASAYDTDLTNQLATIASADTVNVHVIDTYQLVDNAVGNPAAYGLTNVTSWVWTGNFTSASSGTLATSNVVAKDQFLFWDTLHPTETGHQAIADLAEEQLSGRPVLAVEDTTTDQPVTASGTPYTGPVSGLEQQYTNITTDNLNISPPQHPTGSLSAAAAKMRLQSPAAPTCWMAALGQTSSLVVAGQTRFSLMIVDRQPTSGARSMAFMPVTLRQSGVSLRRTSPCHG